MKLKEKIDKIILASQSVVRQKILLDHNINCDVVPSKLDEEPIKEKLIINNIGPDEISRNLASLKAKKVSNKFFDRLVLGADSVINLNGELISKPTNRKQAMEILKKLNGKIHHLISSVSIFKNGKEVESVANRIVVFANSLQHTGTTHTNTDYRIVLNIN